MKKEKDHRLCLTTRQEAVYEYIKKCIKENGYSPTIREIGNAVGLNSTASVHSIICILKEKGYVEYGKIGSSRTLHLTENVNKGYAPHLPASPGDPVWVVEAEMVNPYEVDAYLIKKQGIFIHLTSRDCNHTMTAYPDNFGRNVFLTQEKAAEALMRMKEEYDFED